MLVDLQLSKRKILVVILDPGELSTRLNQLVDARCSAVQIITSKNRSKSLILDDKSSQIIKVDHHRKVLEITRQSVLSFKPFLTLISTGVRSLDKKVAGIAKDAGSLVYVVDAPKLNDLNMPAVARLGEDVRVAISTGGKSPAIASILRKRIERIIRKEDILQVKLQGRLRKEIRRSEANPVRRKEMIYQLLRDKTIRNYLRDDRFDEAAMIGLQRIKKSRI